MKCPKCGYNSFEYFDSCKKCNADLISFKVAHGIRPTILPAKDLTMAGAIEEPAYAVAPAPLADTVQDSEEFSWHDSSEETATGPGTLPSLGLDLPPPEPDHFNFNLDLPSEEAESVAAGDPEPPFEGFGNDEEDFLLKPEAAADPQPVSDEPSTQEEQPFGELSFEDMYSVQENEMMPAAAEEAALPDFFTPDDSESVNEPAANTVFDGLLELERTSEEVAPSLPQEAAEHQDSVSFLTDELPEEESAGSDVDLLGLSPEEYESLFGESPLKKKGTGRETGEATLSSALQ